MLDKEGDIARLGGELQNLRKTYGEDPFWRVLGTRFEPQELTTLRKILPSE
jgi:hypothetical protein